MGKHMRIRPVSIPDLVYSQPFEFCISFSLFLLGLGSLNDIGSLSQVVENRASQVLFWVWTVAVIAGAIAVLASFMLSPRAERKGLGHVSRNRTLEQVGLIMLATSALAFSAAVLAQTGWTGLYTLAIMSGVVAASGLRIVRLRRDDAATLRWLRVVREKVDYSADDS